MQIFDLIRKTTAIKVIINAYVNGGKKKAIGPLVASQVTRVSIRNIFGKETNEQPVNKRCLKMIL